ncbi:MAG: transporter [Anaerolineae bacterium SG8_19]|jgi:small neutral amino acid transporter SnatA (MarC family)|nr:MAG: transporter [Anaerolineae bacterium SG8_19]
MFDNIDFYLVFDLFLLFLIGMGPKIALVPFLDLTQGMEADTQRKIANTMVRTAVGTALILVVLGWFLMRLLHFTPGAANIAGGIVLLLLALHMLISPGKTGHEEESSGRDPMQMAIYPLAVPYLLNPAGIAALVIASSEIDSIITGALIVGLVLLVGAIDFAIFRNMDKLARHLDPSRLVITEAVFGVLLAALAVQLMVDGLADLGIVAVVSH